MNQRIAKTYKKTNMHRCALLFVLFMSLNACAGRDQNMLESVGNDTPNSTVHDDYSVDLSAFETPSIPDSLAEKANNEKIVYESLPYRVEYSFEDDDEVYPIVASDGVLLALSHQIPKDRYVLEQRIEDELAIIEDTYHNLGYYSAKVEADVDYSSLPVQIKITATSGVPYQVTKADILYPQNYYDSFFSPFIHLNEIEPKSLFDLGLPLGSLANSSDILLAQEKILPWFFKRGFPEASIANSSYSVFPETFTFEAQVSVEPGHFMRLGDIKVQGSNSLNEEFISKIRTWEYGDVWDDRKIQLFEQDLLSFGIFSFVDAKPSASDSEIRDVSLLLIDGAHRTWGGGINYDITRQFGLQLFWENRNLFDEAEKFKVNTNLWLDTQELSFDFIKPDIYKKNHDLEVELLFKHEFTDAFDVNSVTLDTSYELLYTFENSSTFENSYSVKGELGKVIGIADTLSSADLDSLDGREYYYIGTPIKFLYENGTKVYEPSNGYSLELEIAPYYGNYVEDFSTLWVEATAIKYLEIIDDNWLVLALKGHAGLISHADATDVPPSLRFFLGGGNSIRGYAYQSIGPKDKDGDPIGGASFIEGSAELRFRVTESVSVVPFFDMGNLFEGITFNDVTFKYSTGLGIRVITPIGPLRFDAAIPLKDEEKDIKDFQLYVSIGQSF